MKIASQHSECQCIGAREQVVEGFLLGWITLQCGSITPRHTEFSRFIEANLANPPPTIPNETAMTTGIAAQASIGERIVQLALLGHLIETICKGTHVWIITGGIRIEGKMGICFQ